MPTFRQLRYLTALARHRHFGRAADECAVSQPALSVQVQDLEAELGVALVERGRGRIDLTAEGQEVARRSARILAAVGDMVDYARHHTRLLTGPLRLGVIPSIAPYLLPAALPRLQERHPALVLQLRESQTAVIVDELQRGALDVLVLSLPIDAPELETLRLFDDRFLLAVPASHPLAQRSDATTRLLADEPLLLLEEGHCLRDQAMSYCKQVDRGSLSGFGASSLSTIIQMVANGLGITVLPEISLPFEVHDPRIALLPFPPPEPTRAVALAWRRSSPRKRDFVELGKLLTTSRAPAPGGQGACPDTANRGSDISGSRPPQTRPA
jgi:LysR family transcriptional regulator, hydrogen peroxide-inducible genes activator